MGERTNVRYTPLPTDDTQQQQNQRRRSFVSAGNRYGGREDDDNDSNYDIRFDYMPKQKIPWKSIALALFLLAFGSSLLIVSHLIFTGHMGGDNSQAFGFLTIGFLMFLPGLQRKFGTRCIISMEVMTRSSKQNFKPTEDSLKVEGRRDFCRILPLS